MRLYPAPGRVGRNVPDLKRNLDRPVWREASVTVQRIRFYLTGGVPTAIDGDAPVFPDDPDGPTLLENIPQEPKQLGLLVDQERDQWVRDMTKTVLTCREEKIIWAWIGGESLESIGKRFRLTRERIRQIRNDGLWKLKRALTVTEDRFRPAPSSTSRPSSSPSAPSWTNSSTHSADCASKSGDSRRPRFPMFRNPAPASPPHTAGHAGGAGLSPSRPSGGGFRPGREPK